MRSLIVWAAGILLVLAAFSAGGARQPTEPVAAPASEEPRILFECNDEAPSLDAAAQDPIDVAVTTIGRCKPGKRGACAFEGALCGTKGAQGACTTVPAGGSKKKAAKRSRCVCAT
jgi:hypothetical protein